MKPGTHTAAVPCADDEAGRPNMPQKPLDLSEARNESVKREQKQGMKVLNSILAALS